MSKRLPGAWALVLVVGSLAVAPAWASDDSAMLKHVTRESRMRGVIGPEPAPLPVASPAAPGDDDMPNRTGGRGPKTPDEGSSSGIESGRDAWWAGLAHVLWTRWVDFVRR